MISIENLVKFNAQSAGREKLIRLCQYTTKFLKTILHTYYARYKKGGIQVVEFIYKLQEVEEYFVSCRRLLGFGCCTDQFYLALRSLRLYDPVVRTTLTASKLSLSFKMFADHVLWLNQMGFLQVEKQRWIERANQFWYYSVTVNLLRDFYELICVIQAKRCRDEDDLEDELKNLSLGTPVKWLRNYPKLSCDLIKNLTEFLIPYSAVNKKNLHPAILSLFGIISTTMGILQVYNPTFRLLPS